MPRGTVVTVARDNRLLGSFNLDGIPPAPRGVRCAQLSAHGTPSILPSGVIKHGGKIPELNGGLLGKSLISMVRFSLTCLMTPEGIWDFAIETCLFIKFQCFYLEYTPFIFEYQSDSTREYNQVT